MKWTKLELPVSALVVCLGLGSAAPATTRLSAMDLSSEALATESTPSVAWSTGAPTSGAPSSVAAACSATVTQHPDAGNQHADNCSPLAYGSNPASSGTHYGSWAAYKTYPKGVPPGFLVHSLEHGALVIGYNCPGECKDEVAMVQAWINSLPGDPVCFGDRNKIILAPNPALEMRWGAAAWGWTWKAPCLDTASLAAFFRAHYGKAAEAAVCGGGSDLSAIGWCPDALAKPRGIAQRGFPGAVGTRTLWTGSLANRERITVEAALPNGAVLETADLGEAGPGLARADWDEAAFRLRNPSAGKVMLRVRTSTGRPLAVQALTLSP